MCSQGSRLEEPPPGDVQRTQWEPGQALLGLTEKLRMCGEQPSPGARLPAHLTMLMAR